MGIHSVRGFGIVWVSALHEIFSNLIILACHVCFSSTYSVLWDFTHPMIWEFLYLFLFQIFKKLLNFECFCFPYFVLTMGVCFSHVLGIVWINSKKIFPMKWKKAFSIVFKNQQAWNDLVVHRIFPCYGKLYIPRHRGFHEFSSTLNL